MENSKEKIISFFNDLKLFLQTVFNMKDKATAMIKKEAADETDSFMLLCFADLIGLPSPTTYYSLELLPYLAGDLQSWETRILGRKSIIDDKGVEIH